MINSRREPLIWATKHAIFAINPESGALIWRRNVAALQRMFRLGERLFVLTGAGVTSLDVDSGADLGSVELGFLPTTGLATDEQLFVAGPTGAAALGPTGTVRWLIGHDRVEGSPPRQFYACRGPDGFALWREEVVDLDLDDRPGLALGTALVQRE